MYRYVQDIGAILGSHWNIHLTSLCCTIDYFPDIMKTATETMCHSTVGVKHPGSLVRMVTSPCVPYAGVGINFGHATETHYLSSFLYVDRIPGTSLTRPELLTGQAQHVRSCESSQPLYVGVSLKTPQTHSQLPHPLRYSVPMTTNHSGLVHVPEYTPRTECQV
ncbi:hypothetical protein KIPB_001711 [Kipferlia bialata]|uniref:Uncharacterized protein n=1 Tax=Kipferlia bialata TaxID=797122 RepID=A0A9K3CRD4_9EUKA|nr:hypothetical protein KIPB_001711 [Kipferlia bialata]|eukprot:g1711.t1